MLELRPTCENCNKALPPRSLGSTKVKHRPVDPAAHAEFAAAIRTIPPADR